MKVKGLLLASIVLALLVSAVVFTSSSTTAMVVGTESAIPTDQADPLLVGQCTCPGGTALHDSFTACWDCLYTSFDCTVACGDPLAACLTCCGVNDDCKDDCRDTKEECISVCCPGGE